MQTDKMKKKFSISCLAALLCFCLPLWGCAGPKKDISNDKTFKTDYATNQIYRVKQPLFLEKISSGRKMELLVKQPGKMQAGPYSVEEYENGDKKRWPDVAGLLPLKTRVRIKKIELEKDFEMGTLIWVHGEILDGQFAGKTVELQFISKKIRQLQPPASVPTVNPELLELVKE